MSYEKATLNDNIIFLKNSIAAAKLLTTIPPQSVVNVTVIYIISTKRNLFIRRTTIR